MSTMVLQEPRVLTDIKGNTFRLIPEEEYNYMMDIVELLNFMKRMILQRKI